VPLGRDALSLRHPNSIAPKGRSYKGGDVAWIGRR